VGALSGKKYNYEEFIGKKINHWTIVKFLGKRNKRLLISVICDCPNKTLRTTGFYAVISNRSRSCGCVSVELLSARSYRHGKAGTKEYKCWSDMKRRCYNNNNSKHNSYKVRGIKVSPEWYSSFETFYKDMGPCPPDKNSIDRVDNTKGYFPNNCRWATSKEQGNNTSTNRRLTYKEETLTMTQWGEKLKIYPHTIKGRLRMGWPIERALTTPVKKVIRAPSP
jgi:hypothetical protein